MQQNLRDAESLTARMPHLILEARKLATHIQMGLHGRKKAGIGEEFWQYRPLNIGEDMKRIDWRRSARDNHLSVRERELEVAQRLALTPDLSLSMTYGTPQKRDCAVILTLALAHILVEGGEKVQLANFTKPLSSRHIMNEFAQRLLTHETDLTKPQDANPKAEAIVLGDSFSPLESFEKLFSSSPQKGHLLIINAAEEETYPFFGRVLFEEFEDNLKFEVGKAETLKQGYLAKLKAHRDALRALCRKYGWSLTFHVTDKPLAPMCLAFLLQLQRRGA